MPHIGTTIYQYDLTGGLAAGYVAELTTDPKGNTTQKTYDLAGNKLTMTDARGSIWTYTYNDNNNLIKITDPLGHFTSMEYDSKGRMTAQTDANGHTTYLCL